MQDEDCGCWLCQRPGATLEDWQRHVQDVVARRGWLVQAVAARRRRVPWAYTAGLTTLGLDELVVTGMRPDEASGLLDAVAAHALSGAVLLPGETLHAGPLRCELVRLPHPEVHLLTAVGLYGDAVQALQLVWADDRGRLPWEVDHRAGRGGQPVLGSRVATHR